MKNQRAIELIFDFKGSSLKDRFAEIKSKTIGKTKYQIPIRNELFNAALTIKKASAQINEIVHAVGILNALDKILDSDEKVEDLSLAARSEGDGFDLVTDRRLAEFKFSRWQVGSVKNDMRKRHSFADFAKLTISRTEKKKELYVVSANQVTKYFNGGAKWRKVLSKSGGIQDELGKYLSDKSRGDIKTLREVFEISTVQIFDLDDILNITE